eukprot:c7077_g1_i2.p1 GENE.c7077_g1_i2~~c7077_g1_i2.p1  ORF type:complete len:104 (-),score=15.09 c7077_g1_i2:360-671(-)
MQQNMVMMSLTPVPKFKSDFANLLVTMFLLPLLEVGVRTLGSVVSILFMIWGYRLPTWMLQFHPGIFHGGHEFGWEKGLLETARERGSFPFVAPPAAEPLRIH